MRALQIDIPREDLKDYIDWIKALMTVCSAGVGALLYKFDGKADLLIEVAATAFGVALVLLCFTFAGFISHRRGSSDVLAVLTSNCLVLAIVAFLTAVGALIVRLYQS